jgi:hypothetical protein
MNKTTKAQELFDRVSTWPEEDIEKLAAVARDIEAWRHGEYRASEDELRAIDEAIAELDCGERASANMRSRPRSDLFGAHDRVFAPRAVRDLDQIGAYYRRVASKKVAGAAAERLRHVINLFALQPEIAPRIPERPARRPWLGED